MHEFVASARTLARDRGIRAMDIGKRLIDLQLPRPDGLFPADRARGADDRADRDREPRDARGLRRGPAGRSPTEDPEMLHDAPHTTPISRPDEVKAAKTPVLTWKPA